MYPEVIEIMEEHNDGKAISSDTILFHPQETLQQIGFDKVLEVIQSYCQSDLARLALEGALPSIQARQIEHEYELVKDIHEALEHRQKSDLQPFENCEVFYNYLDKANYVLAEEDFFQILAQLNNLESLYRFWNDDRRQSYPNWYADWQDIQYDNQPYAAVHRVIDEKGKVRPNASPELLAISRSIESAERNLDKVFGKLLSTYKQRGLISETGESVRGGRRVVTIKSEHKRSIHGIIHDESATGKTAYIEPEEMVQLNNQIFDLWMDHKREVRRILTELTQHLASYKEPLQHWQAYLIHYDVLLSKAKFGRSIGGNYPKLVDESHFYIKEARHPLLLLKHRQDREQVIPMTLHLGKKNRILLLSGPNAGGKSVALKTLGLIQWMAQLAIPVPVHPESELGVFHKLYVAIGDLQSIEDDLSTYSSRLTLMKHMLDHADHRSLILIDEFGSGTDPQIGGAIAAEILLAFNRLRTVAMITTHYSNLKLLVDSEPGMVNGAMLFDPQTLKPTYRLKVGKPGSSYALEIAADCGLPKPLIRAAQRRMGKGMYKVDHLLRNLEDEKHIVEGLLKDNENKQQQLDKLIKSYNQMSLDLEVQKKKLKLRSKEIELQNYQRYQKEIDQLIKQLRTKQDAQEAKQLSQRVKNQQKSVEKEVKALDEAVYTQPAQENRKPLEVGDFAKHIRTEVSGEILRIEKKKAWLQIGDLQMTIPLKELIPAREPLPHKPQRSIQTELKSNPYDFKSQLDIRGLKATEAIKVVESFIDKAIVANAYSVKILHGKGNGVLKKLVQEKLGEYPAVEDISHPEPEWGGEGITIARLAGAS